MTTIVCDIDGCTETRDVAKRGYQQMGLHRLKVHGLAAGTAPKPRKVDDETRHDSITSLARELGGKPDGETHAPARPPATETAPKRSKWRERFKRHSNKDTTATPSRERAPKRTFRGKRVPLDTDFSDAWGFLGRRLEGGPHYPTGRMLQYQAPGAGVILDKAVQGTFFDNVVLQPLARQRDKYEDAAFLIAGPLITFSITRSYQELSIALQEGDTDRAEVVKRRLRTQFEGFDWLINAMLPRLAEGKKVAEEKEAKTRAVIDDAFPELAGTGVSPAEALRDMLFAPPTFQGDSHEGTGAAAQNGDRPDSVAFGERAPGGVGSPA